MFLALIVTLAVAGWSVVVNATLADEGYELFAIVGGSQCAEALYYGPLPISEAGSVDGHEYYFATDIATSKLPHNEWVQIVTEASSGSELFRIYWKFDDFRSLSERFIHVVRMGDPVSYRVVDTAGVNGVPGQNYNLSGLWKYSDTASITAAKFAVTSSTLRFSNDDGAWGAGEGEVNGDGPVGSQFWGQGNFNAVDARCREIYVSGIRYAVETVGKSFLYFRITTQSPTVAPSLQPSTLAPTRIPTIASTPRPTIVPTLVDDSYQLFAIVGGKDCAENLAYGPSLVTSTGSSDGFEYYFSTSMPLANTPHHLWLQVVTSDGINELFRIYWTFHTDKSVIQRFVDGVSTYEPVNFYVVDTAGVSGTSRREYFYSGQWRFSASSGITDIKFLNLESMRGFSANDGAWGASSGVVDGNATVPSDFWGIANFQSTDSSECGKIYCLGSVYEAFSSSKTYFYARQGLLPTAAPTIQPVPTIIPTLVPTARPSTRTPTTAHPTIQSDEYELFAVVGGESCAENLHYGPSRLTLMGSEDGYPYYLCTRTDYGHIAHRYWMQVVYSGSGQLLFQIYWVFSEDLSLRDRFIKAVSEGIDVGYMVVDVAGLGGPPGEVYEMSGTWRYSSTAQITSAKFDVKQSTHSFSQDDGMWGAAPGLVDGQGMTEIKGFWGIGNLDTSDSSCSHVYVNGVPSSRYGSVRVGMYLMKSEPGPTMAPSNRPPSVAPTRRPTISPTLRPSVRPTTAPPTRLPTLSPSRAPTLVSSQWELFAIVGGSSCAESLRYGTYPITMSGSPEGYQFYLSTSVPYSNVPHHEWLQVVTSEITGVELFRIYWTFSTKQPLPDRFVDTVWKAVPVTYRIVDTAGLNGGPPGKEYNFSSSWRFSSASGIVYNNLLMSGTRLGFSLDDGAWGASPSTVDGNGQMPSGFWGQGNFDSSDIACETVYYDSKQYGRGRSYFFLMKVDPPTFNPTRAPTRVPTQAATSLFAVIGGSQCAENLYYGPSVLTMSGSADGRPYYFSTVALGAYTAHNEWIQVVTDAVTSAELFRIHWSFATPLTLKNRFVQAVSIGEVVTYRIIDTSGVAGSIGREYTYVSTWRFSNNAGNFDWKFSVQSSTHGFSQDDGAWGAAPYTVNGNGLLPSQFWGQGNFDSTDAGCSSVYANGVQLRGVSGKSYFWISSGVPTASPTFTPTAQTAPIVVIEHRIVILNILSSFTTTAISEAVARAIAQVLGVLADWVKVTNTFSAPPNLRVQTTSYGYTFVVETHAGLQFFPWLSTTTQLFEYLAERLQQAMESGELEAAIRAQNASAPELVNSNVSSVTSAFIEEWSVPGSDGDSDDNATETVIIVVVVIVVVLIALAIFYCCFKRLIACCCSSSSSTATNTRNTTTTGYFATATPSASLPPSSAPSGVVVSITERPVEQPIAVVNIAPVGSADVEMVGVDPSAEEARPVNESTL